MTPPRSQATGVGIGIGKIVRSESHVRYTCQVYGPGEVAAPPEPADYAFGSFVRIPLRLSAGRADVLAPSISDAHGRADVADPLPLFPPPPSTVRAGEERLGSLAAIGLIYDTLLL